MFDGKSPEDALRRLMVLCSRREYCGGDVLRLMERWGVGEAGRADVLGRLERDKFVDDRRFAGAFVRDKFALGGWGVYKIRSALRAKGLSDVIITQALSEIDTGKAQEKLEDLLRRKMVSVGVGKPYEVKGKLVRFALSRGYGYDEVLEAVERLVAGVGDDE